MHGRRDEVSSLRRERLLSFSDHVVPMGAAIFFSVPTSVLTMIDYRVSTWLKLSQSQYLTPPTVDNWSQNEPLVMLGQSKSLLKILSLRLEAEGFRLSGGASESCESSELWWLCPALSRKAYMQREGKTRTGEEF